MTCCRICHRPLTDPTSVARGVGPVCAPVASLQVELPWAKECGGEMKRAMVEFECDRCGEKWTVPDENASVAYVTLTDKDENEDVSDLCLSCFEQVKAFVKSAPVPTELVEDSEGPEE